MINTIKAEVAQLCGLKPNSLVVCEIQHHHISRIFTDFVKLKTAMSGGTLVAYEVETFKRKASKGKKSSDSSASCSTAEKRMLIGDVANNVPVNDGQQGNMKEVEKCYCDVVNTATENLNGEEENQEKARKQNTGDMENCNDTNAQNHPNEEKKIDGTTNGKIEEHCKGKENETLNELSKEDQEKHEKRNAEEIRSQSEEERKGAVEDDEVTGTVSL